MATQFLRTLDRWRFETPMAVMLAGAAGYAVMAMPHDLFAQLPVAGDYGRPAQAGLAVLAALLCGIAGYLAMRRPTKRAPIVEDDEDLDLFFQPDPVAAPIPVRASEPVRLRRADRHPDAPAREPIRASRDLGEPFMDVAPLATPAHAEPEQAEPEQAEPEQAESEPVEPEHVEIEPIEDAAPVAEPREFEAAEQDIDEIEQPREEAAVPHDEPVAADPAPIATPDHEPVALHAVATPIVAMPVHNPVGLPFVTPGRRDDTSLAAMIDRLSEGMKLRGEATRTIEPPRDRSPALRDALDELNRLAVRRG